MRNNQFFTIVYLITIDVHNGIVLARAPCMLSASTFEASKVNYHADKLVRHVG